MLAANSAQCLHECDQMASVPVWYKMKLNPKDLNFAIRVDLDELLKIKNRPQFRAAVSENLGHRRLFSPRMVLVLAGSADLFGTILAGLLAALKYPGLSANVPWLLYGAFMLMAAVLLVVFVKSMGLYQFGNLVLPFRKIPKLITAWVTTFAIVVSCIFLLKSGLEVSRIWLTSWALAGLCLFIAWRFVVGAFLRRLNHDGHFNKSAVLVGGGENAARVISVVENSGQSGVNLIGVFDDRDDGRVPSATGGLFKLGGIDDLIDFVRSTPVDTLIITLPTYAEERIVQLLNRLWILPVDIRLSAQGQKLHLRPRAYSYIGNLPCLDVYDKPLGEWGPFFKTLMDKTLAAIALVMIAPLLAAIAIAIKLDSKGPVIFKQKRYGFNNELIEVYKFRSMHTSMADANAAKLVTRDDPRVTRVGRFMRRTTLDELPQFFNVLKGDLSLVGPRPHATQAKAGTDLYEHVVDGYFARHRVKPGITGWAQVNGWRGETDTADKIERRVEYDLYYIENWSLTFDLYILARTPIALLNTKNAY